MSIAGQQELRTKIVFFLFSNATMRPARCLSIQAHSTNESIAFRQHQDIASDHMVHAQRVQSHSNCDARTSAAHDKPDKLFAVSYKRSIRSIRCHVLISSPTRMCVSALFA